MTGGQPGKPLRLTGRLVVATHNPGKLREILELLAPSGVDAVSAGELKLDEPEETGATFRDNAALKAEAAARASGIVALADDSGLCVEALGGAPGIYSARWAGGGKDRFQRGCGVVRFGFLPKPESNAQDDHHEHDNGTARAAAVSWVGQIRYDRQSQEQDDQRIEAARISSSSRL